ncbi:MAG TPA: carbonic anhydrase [Gemmatimonas aurantiaca]|uniref:Carbonic anhydrase n=2 Tax=Gemmatimonas aurantiaca TaxID=173480 RepID=C1AAY1_GEMAT|nr:carbonic anhydrase [Gemmatimonas aurantiaca]BAH39387.1 carbonic anhydrase [Gemmatimonas aurantiaca T-27]HCT56016.1 carbonic anhydrase [Gemmatimonas aurantiaca]
MDNFRKIIQNNREWAAAVVAADPDYFARHAKKQEPLFLYIGCSDSRVPANVVTGTVPGDLFVHRNIANLVVPSDLNAMSVLQYAVEVLDVKHIIVTGHYGCGGVKAAMSTEQHGLVDHWLQPIRNVVRWNRPELDAIIDDQARFDRVVELNVLEQLYHLSETPVIQNAWAKGRRPLLHGLVYDLNIGILKEVATSIDSQEAADLLAARRLSGVPAGPPPMTRNATPPLSSDDLADSIAHRVAERLAAAGWEMPGGKT